MSNQEVKGIFKACGADIYFETKGSGDNMLFLHAGIADSRMWDYEFDVMATHFRVIRMDLPRYGGSCFTGGHFSYSTIIKDLLEHLKADPVHIIAASFGGKIALDFVLEHPESCVSMALMSPAVGGWEDSLFLQEYEKEEERLLSEGKIEEAALLNVNVWIAGERNENSVDPKVKELVMDMQLTSLRKQDPQTPVIELEAEDNVHKLKNLTCPLLVITGRHDVQDFHQIADLIMREVPSAQRKTLPDASHLANLDCPERFSDILLDFFLMD